MKIGKILLTTDLSDEAERPYAAVAELARATGARVTLLHVVEDVAVAPHGAPLAPPIHAFDTSAAIEDAKAILAEHAKRFEGVQVDFDAVAGSPVVNTIADYAEEHGYDLLAVSTHGRGGFRRMVMGSVAETLLRHARLPVLVFPRNE
ncbi:MAG TPA: universal stress protein [Planctomycetes bacterium]|nr:universal stress protein [Planctomycetota bacterium]